MRKVWHGQGNKGHVWFMFRDGFTLPSKFISISIGLEIFRWRVVQLIPFLSWISWFSTKNLHVYLHLSIGYMKISRTFLNITIKNTFSFKNLDGKNHLTGIVLYVSGFYAKDVYYCLSLKLLKLLWPMGDHPAAEKIMKNIWLIYQ